MPFTLRWVGPPRILCLAVVLVWATVAYGAANEWAQGRLPATYSTAFGMGATAAIALCFVAANLRFTAQPNAPRRRSFVLLQAPLALLAFWGLREETSLALLVVVAGQLVQSFDLWPAVSVMAASNLAAGWMLRVAAPHGNAWRTWLSFAAFQLFAATTARLAVNARRARDEVLRVNNELQAMQHLLEESARVGERLRLSRELHDLMGHKLTALKLQLRELARPTTRTAVETDLRDGVANCYALADELLQDVRAVVGAMRCDDGIDLHAALRALVQSLPLSAIELDIEPGIRVPQVEQANALLRCAQEGVTNALKHADAAHICLALRRCGEGFVLLIEDDGIGLGAAPSAQRWGNGLAGMAERVRLLGGTLVLSNGTAHGVRLTVTLPERTAGAGPLPERP